MELTLNFNLKNKIMKKNVFKTMRWPMAVLTCVVLIGCTDLEIEESDSIIDDSTSASGNFSGVPDIPSALNSLYDGFNVIGDQQWFYALQEISSDGLLVPTRGTDWGDNGLWRTLHQHTWDSGHPFILKTWNDWNSFIFSATSIIDERSNANADQVAQASFARAFATFIIMDNYGQVPFRGPAEGPEIDPMVMNRTEALDFILADLDVAIADLPSVEAMDMDNLNRGTKASARFLKAKMLLNAHIYRGEAEASAADMQEVISLVDQIAAEGFALQEGYFDIFKEDADTETIWWLPTGVGNRIWNGMHYNHNSPDNEGGGWNGFSALSEFYDSFEGASDNNYVGAGQEERRGWVPDASNAGPDNLGIGYGFLFGQQYDTDGSQLTTRGGAPLVITKDYPGLQGNAEDTGIRTIKWHPVNGSFTAHEIQFRYADAHLMKAEAMMRMGGDPTALVNELRVLRQASPLGTVGEVEMIAERGRELYKEWWRRNDLIRFGQFTKDWEFKNPESVGDDSKNLFPVPINALLS
ncbi:MAG: RagB/SusD family nutrient uptake outer membrane protein, partial [Pricia sp.]